MRFSLWNNLEKIVGGEEWTFASRWESGEGVGEVRRGDDDNGEGWTGV
jgi:hypothetical protein